MENRKHFTLKEYLENPKKEIETRDGKPVRVVCTDATGLNRKPIVALIKQPNGDEAVHTYWKDGTHTAGSEDNLDLFWKLEEEYRPYTQEELFNQVRCYGAGWVCQKGYSHIDLITRIDVDNLATANIGRITYEEALKELTWANSGKPFGVKK